RIAAPNAVFGHRGVALGLVTGWGGTQRLPDVVGTSTALAMFVAAEKIHAPRALRIGMIDGIAEDPVAEVARRIGLTSANQLSASHFWTHLFLLVNDAPSHPQGLRLHAPLIYRKWFPVCDSWPTVTKSPSPPPRPACCPPSWTRPPRALRPTCASWPIWF